MLVHFAGVSMTTGAPLQPSSDDSFCSTRVEDASDFQLPSACTTAQSAVECVGWRMHR